MMNGSALETFNVKDCCGISRVVPKWLKDILDRHPKYAFRNAEKGRVELFFQYPEEERVRDAIVEMAPVGRVVDQYTSDMVGNGVNQTVVMSF
jgi:hypothetical protein